MKQKIIAIVGDSGTGKSTLAAYIERELGIRQLVSHTTRPMREGEHNGVGHYFVTEDEMPPRSRMLAYTYFGGNHYWVDLRELRNDPIVTYVIDEKGLMMLLEEYSDAFDIIPVLIRRDPALRLADGIPADRIQRDRCRVHIEDAQYAHIFDNNGPLNEFLYNAKTTLLNLKDE